MSFPTQRFFSLSGSNNNNDETQGPTSTSAAPSNSNQAKFLDQNSLDLLVRAASGGGGATPASINNVNQYYQGNTNSDMNYNNNNPASTDPSATSVDGNNNNNAYNNNAGNTPTVDNNNNLQQAFLQSMASQQQQQQQQQQQHAAHPSAIFGSPPTNTNSGIAQGQQAGGMNLNGGTAAAQQFGQLFGNIQAAQQQQQQQQNQNPQGNYAGTPQAAPPQDQAQSQPPSGLGSVAQQGHMISQLVASLQAQQQAQQQAQVQAALVRAFGPGANTMGGAAAAATNPLGMAATNAGGNNHPMGGGAPGNNGQGGMQGIQGLNMNSNDLLSRMQLAQAVQGQQQQHVQQLANAQAGQAQANQQQQGQGGGNPSFEVTKAASAAATNAAISAGSATADDFIKLQLEQERHNRMLQMVQADRQERAMLANQESMMKKARRDLKNGGEINQGIGNVSMNDAVSTIFNQFPNANALNAMAAGGATNPMAAATSLLTNGLNSAQFAAANGIAQVQGNKLPGLNQVQNLQNGLMPNLAGLGCVPEEQHLHQKLGSARGAAIVPCRARGMPVDHNFKTAYFVIPDAIEHGDELMCSYPACRQAGVKFRYCLHCKVPVAKRNFRNRHRHGVPGGDGASASGVEEEESEDDTAEGAGTDGSNPMNGDMCQPVADDEDYAGVKKEHILIIPGADNTDAMPMKKKKKKNGNVRVPCRARGMPMAHNFKTAYFIIPPTIEHGDELLCSFPTCRSAGAKFRYCLHCKVPVAKRNFRNRHKHGNMGGLDKKKSSLKTPESPNDGVEKAKQAPEGSNAADNSDMPELPAVKVDGGEKPPAVGLDSVKPESHPVVNETIQMGAAIAVSDPLPSTDDGKVTVSSSHDANKVQKWVELLENKPNPGDKQAMAVWMLNLMNATEGSGGAGMASAMAAAAGGAPPVEVAPAAATAQEDVAAADIPAAEPQVEEKEAMPVEEEEEEMPVEEEEEEMPVEEEGGNKRESGDEECANSTASSSSQPPKKKFKEEVEVEEV